MSKVILTSFKIIQPLSTLVKMANKCTSGPQALGLQNGKLPAYTELGRTGQKTDSIPFSFEKTNSMNKKVD